MISGGGRECFSPEAVASALFHQPGGFEGLGSHLEHPKASDPPALDREHKRAPRDHLDPLAPAQYLALAEGASGVEVGHSLAPARRNAKQ